MKIALAQTRIVWEDKKANIEKASCMIREQARAGAELVLFPEMSFTGFSMHTGLTKEDGHDTCDRMEFFARENRIAIGFGWVKDCGGKCENHYSVMDREGRVAADYAKLHPFSYSGEDRYFRGGDKTVVFRLEGIAFSIFICYDLRFPEIFQAVSEDASVIIVPANWPEKRREHWNTLLRARAIENQVYILGINCVGDIGGQYYSGDSCIIDPDGKVKDILTQKEGVICYELSDDVDVYRQGFPIKRDRREELYRKFQGTEERG